MPMERQKRSQEKEKGPDLPWWVELLFVQIGLPDSWLRSFLKTRKKVKAFSIDNKKNIIYSMLVLSAIVYVNPIFKQARNHNICIDGSKEYVETMLPDEVISSRKSLLAWANRFCNGGRL